jgi:hypothetical protein
MSILNQLPSDVFCVASIPLLQKLIPDMKKHVLLKSSLFGGNYRCEQLFSSVKNDKL